MPFVITLTDEEFSTLSDRSKWLDETLVMRKPQDDITVIIQRCADPDEISEDDARNAARRETK